MSRIEFTSLRTLPYNRYGVIFDQPSAKHFSVNGTATSAALLPFHNAYSLPAWFNWDTTYNLHMSHTGNTNVVQFQIQIEDNNGTWTTPVRTGVDTGFRISQPAAGFRQMTVGIRVAAGVTADEIVYPYLIEQPAFYPRLSAQGIRYSPYWYSLNPFYNTANPNPPPANYGLANCTCYAWGRFWEISDPNRLYDNNTRPRLSTGNGQDFFPYTQDGYTRGRTPALGAIACYSGGNYSGLGHVCVLEKDNGDGTWLVSESAWNGYFFRASHNILANGDYNDVNAGYTFQGFIYNPYAGDTDTPPYIEGSNLHLILAKRAIQRGKGELII